MMLGALNKIYAQMVDIDKIFLANPEARLYIYSNMRPEDLRPDASPAQYQVDQATAMAAAELMLDFFAQVTIVLPKLGKAGDSWIIYIKDVYKCSPVLRERYEKNTLGMNTKRPLSLLIRRKQKCRKVKCNATH